MALKIFDRVKETTATTGTGTITLAGAVANFETFASNLSDGDTTYYAIVDGANNAFEVGLGTFTASGTTLARTTIIASSNSNNAVDLAAGTKEVFITVPADKMIVKDASGNISVSADTDATAEIGRAHIGNVGFADTAGFSHVDYNATGNYALLQNSSGKTFLNAVSGQSINFNINNTDVMDMSNSGLYFLPGKQIIFEGTTANNFETFIGVVDPTADRGINFPDASGTIALTSQIPSVPTNASIHLKPHFVRVSNDDSGNVGASQYIKVATIDSSTPSTSNSTFVLRILIEGRFTSLGASQFRVHIRSGESTGTSHVVVEQEHNNKHTSFGVSNFIFFYNNQSDSEFWVKLPNNISFTFVELYAKLEVAATVDGDDPGTSGQDDITIHAGQSWTTSAPTGTNQITAEWIKKRFDAIIFEGSTDDGNETFLEATNPTADRTITLPDATGTVSLVDATETLTNKTITTPVITEIDSGSSITLDATTDIILDADGGDIFLKDGGTTFGEFTNSSTDFVIKSTTSNKDMFFKGVDSGSEITALTLDMSLAGKATFNAGAIFGGDIEAKSSDGAILKLETSETGVTTDHVLGRIEFKAPNDTSGGAAIKPSVSISAVAKSIFGAGQNKSDLVFKAASTGTGDESEKMILEPEGNLIVKSSDGAILKLQTSDTTVVDGNVLGAIEFSAPDEASGGDAITTAFSIIGEADSTYSAGSNAADLVFKADANEVMRLEHTGNVQFPLGNITAKDSSGAILKLQTSDTTVVDGNVLGAIEFSAPNEASGGVSDEISAAIVAEADITFSSADNDTDLVFKVGTSGAATEKMRLEHTGDMTLARDLTLTNSLEGFSILKEAASGTGTIGWKFRVENPSGTTNNLGISRRSTNGGHTSILNITNNGHIHPAANNQQDLGESGTAFRNAYFSGTLEANQITTSGTLTVNGDLTAKTSDGAILKLQTSDTTVEDGDVIGAIEFSAPDEASGSDAVTTAASIVAEADQEFSTTINRTDLVFNLGVTGAASEKMRLEHGGSLILSNVENNGGMTINGAAPLIKIEKSGSSILGGSTLGRLRFSAPNESSGGDAITTAAEIDVVADSTFDATNNKTNIEFKLGSSGVATEKMRLEHDGTLVLQSAKITGLADPTNAQEAATKAYVDANAGGGGGISTGKAIAMAMVFG